MIVYNAPCSLAQLQAVAQRLASCSFESLLIYFYGDIGAGKTTFVQSYLAGMGYTGMVKSPTFSLIESYQIESIELFHLDLYRLDTADELYSIGIDDCMGQNCQLLVEWPQKGFPILPEPDLEIHLDKNHDFAQRQLKIVASSSKGIKLLTGFK